MLQILLLLDIENKRAEIKSRNSDKVSYALIAIYIVDGLVLPGRNDTYTQAPVWSSGCVCGAAGRYVIVATQAPQLLIEVYHNIANHREHS